jgi:hypothetical protein
LKQLLIEIATKVKLENLCLCTLAFETQNQDKWSFVIKNYEIEF